MNRQQDNNGGVPRNAAGEPGHAGRVTLPNEPGHAGRVTLPVRKRIDHRGPLSIDVSRAWYFVTLCAAGHRPWVGSRVPRDRDDTLNFDSIANAILSAARWYHEHGKWRLSLFLVMPDHVHFIVHVPDDGGGHAGRVTLPAGERGHAGRVTLPKVVQQFKAYLMRMHGIAFQRDFWETRIRNEQQCGEEFCYICNNPVRKGLCRTAHKWRYVIAFDTETGEERAHRGGRAGECGHAGRVTLPNEPSRAGRMTLPNESGHAGRVTLP